MDSHRQETFNLYGNPFCGHLSLQTRWLQRMSLGASQMFPQDVWQMLLSVRYLNIICPDIKWRNIEMWQNLSQHTRELIHVCMSLPGRVNDLPGRTSQLWGQIVDNYTRTDGCCTKNFTIWKLFNILSWNLECVFLTCFSCLMFLFRPLWLL